jgi:ABC-type cobalamin/Fe3+-siderophores transport system ATPase subunit
MEEGFSCVIPLHEISGKRILSDICFDIQDSQIVVLLGKNGAGKTTLVKNVLESPKGSQGKFILDGQDLSVCSSMQRAVLLSHLGSSDFSKPEVTASQFLNMCETGYGTQPAPGKDVKTVLDTLSFWQISHLEKTRVSKFSQGEFQRLLLASVFRQEAKLYLLDEPERHLDPEGLCLLKEMLFLKKAQGKMVLLATHDVGFAVSLAGKIIGLDGSGKQMFFTTVEACLDGALLDRIYGVRFTIYRDTHGVPQCVSASLGRT